MDTNIQNFLYLNGFILVILVGYMLFRKPKKTPSRLKLRESLFGNKLDVADPQKNSDQNKWHGWGDSSQGGGAGVRRPNKAEKNSNHDESIHDSDQANAPARQLTALFQYNGHTFEAYEVLGLAAGASAVKVDDAYQEIMRTQSKDTHPFFEKAYQAIQRK
ncbi:MAG: hypothetical protein ABL927_11170 [Bdellovibrionales bacterium]